MNRRPVRSTIVVGIGAAALTFTGAGVASAAPAEPGPAGDAYDALDDLADALACDGPLGGLLRQLVNCDPEDEPPFTSVPQE